MDPLPDKSIEGTVEYISWRHTRVRAFNQFGASSLDILVYCFTKSIVWTQYHEVKQDVLLKIGGITARHGAEIAFPTQTVHLPDAPGSGDAPAPLEPGGQAAPAWPVPRPSRASFRAASRCGCPPRRQARGLHAPPAGPARWRGRTAKAG